MLKPKKQPHYKKHINTLHCRWRVGRSFLKSHGFAINLSPTDKCLCGDIDDTKHYLFTCFLFQEERHLVFDTINGFHPTFKRICGKKDRTVTFWYQSYKCRASRQEQGYYFCNAKVFSTNKPFFETLCLMIFFLIFFPFFLAIL